MSRNFLILFALLLICIASLTQAQQPQPLPLAGRDSVELLTNGGFEIDANGDKVPDGWDAKNTALPKPDKIKCDKPGKPVAHTGTCAFMFQGNLDGMFSTISQKITDVSSLSDGATLTFSAYLDPRNSVAGEVFGKVNIKLSNGEQIKLSLVIPANTLRDVADYVQISESTTLNLSGVSVVKIKVKFLNKAPNGRFVIDDASLIANDDNLTTPTLISTSQPTITLDNPTDPPTNILTDTPTNTSTHVLTATPTEIIITETVTDTSTATSPAIPTITFTPSLTASSTKSPTPTPSSTRSNTATKTPNTTPTDGPSPTPTITLTPSITSSPTDTPTYTPIPLAPDFVFQAKDGDENDLFGISVAISGDTVLIGASDKGAAYVFVNKLTGWTQQAKLIPNDSPPYGLFGISVAIAGDTAVIGAPSNNSQGAVYIFTRTNGIWTQEAKLIPDDIAIGDAAGHTVAISGDTVIFSSIRKNYNRGAAYIFKRNGTVWAQQQKLAPHPLDSNISFFGIALALSEDMAVIGMPYGPGGGRAYIFTCNDNAWVEQDYLSSSHSGYNGSFGASLALYEDTLAVGEPNLYVGSVQMLTFSEGSWIRHQPLFASDASYNANFGSSVAVYGDIMVIGANTKNNDKGGAYIFVRRDGLWTEKQQLTIPDITVDGEFGYAVAIDNTTVVVSAPFDDSEIIRQGKAWAFTVP